MNPRAIKRLEPYDETRHPYQKGGLVAVDCRGNYDEFWGGHDGEMPTTQQLRRLAACWSLCRGWETALLESPTRRRHIFRCL